MLRFILILLVAGAVVAGPTRAYADPATPAAAATAEKVVTGVVKVAKNGDQTTVSIVANDGRSTTALADSPIAKAVAMHDGQTVKVTGEERDHRLVATKFEVVEVAK